MERKDYSNYYSYIDNASDEVINKHLREIMSKIDKRANASLSEVEHAILSYFGLTVRKNSGYTGASLYYLKHRIYFYRGSKAVNIVDYIRKHFDRYDTDEKYYNVVRNLYYYGCPDGVKACFSCKSPNYLDMSRAIENFVITSKYRKATRIIRNRDSLREQIHSIRERYEADMNDAKHNICMCNADLSKLIYGGMAR